YADPLTEIFLFCRAKTRRLILEFFQIVGITPPGMSIIFYSEHLSVVAVMKRLWWLVLRATWAASRVFRGNSKGQW
ncbi:hypothetical protein M5Y49_13810, partial [Escherichia coli]|nr:hypothetical protein [Escherichia coli]